VKTLERSRPRNTTTAAPTPTTTPATTTPRRSLRSPGLASDWWRIPGVKMRPHSGHRVALPVALWPHDGQSMNAMME
jgi:hypothetical protein